MSEYEQQRLARLQRNRQVMKQLGLPTAPAISVEKKGSKQHLKHSNKATVVNSVGLAFTRRSARLGGAPRPNFRESHVWAPKKRRHEFGEENESVSSHESTASSIETEQRKRSLRRPNQETITEAMSSVESVQLKHSTFIDAPKTKSCIEIDAYLEELQSMWVGRVFKPPEGSGAMKETVMREIAQENPIFSKYSGLQEFRNAIILFVNVGGRDYENVFFIEDKDENRTVSLDWFASPKVKPDSRAIKKLLKATEVKKDFGVFLFLRFEGEPYLSCGPCLVLDSVLDTRPMRFRLRILNVTALEERAGELFTQLVNGERND